MSMSLIHEALKKAEQKEKPNIEASSLPQKSASPPPKKRGLRVYLLLILLLLSIAGVGYFRFYKPHQEVISKAALAPQPSLLPQESSKEQLWLEAEQIFSNQDWNRGLQVFQRLLLTDPTNPEVYNNLGMIYKKMGQTKEAYKQYENALAIKPDYPEALNNLGALLLADLRLGEAKQNFEKAIVLKSNYPEPFFNLGVILEAQGDHRGALKNYQQFLELATDLDADLYSKIKRRLSLLERRLL